MAVELTEESGFNAIDATQEHRFSESSAELLSADVVIDRFDIERRASELIAIYSQNKYIKNKQGYTDDARTAIFEALTASGHLSVVRSRTTSLDIIHKEMLTVLLNAWSDTLPLIEQQRRFQEICEELTIQEIEKLKAGGFIVGDIEVATISDYTSQISEKQALELGYRPYNKKGMIRSARLVDHHDGTYTRITKQVSRSNADARTSERFLNLNNIQTRNESTADVRVLGTQSILTGELASAGVLGIMKRLDQFCGSGIRYGDVANSKQANYEDLEQESKRREAEAEIYIDKLANYTRKLDLSLSSGEITYVQHQELLKNQIHTILQSICTIRPEYTIDCFGEDSLETYESAALMTAAGDMVGASNIIEANSHKEQTITLCGMSISKEEAESRGIKGAGLVDLMALGKENFKTKIGRCRVPECPSPRPTEVGPCDVCMASCQPRFDTGQSINKIIKSYRLIKRASKVAIKKTSNSIFWPFSFNKSTKHENIK